MNNIAGAGDAVKITTSGTISPIEIVIGLTILLLISAIILTVIAIKK